LSSNPFKNRPTISSKIARLIFHQTTVVLNSGEAGTPAALSTPQTVEISRVPPQQQQKPSLPLQK